MQCNRYDSMNIILFYKLMKTSFSRKEEMQVCDFVLPCRLVGWRFYSQFFFFDIDQIVK